MRVDPLFGDDYVNDYIERRLVEAGTPWKKPYSMVLYLIVEHVVSTLESALDLIREGEDANLIATLLQKFAEAIAGKITGIVNDDRAWAAIFSCENQLFFCRSFSSEEERRRVEIEAFIRGGLDRITGWADGDYVSLKYKSYTGDVFLPTGTISDIKNTILAHFLQAAKYIRDVQAQELLRQEEGIRTRVASVPLVTKRSLFASASSTVLGRPRGKTTAHPPSAFFHKPPRSPAPKPSALPLTVSYSHHSARR